MRTLPFFMILLLIPVLGVLGACSAAAPPTLPPGSVIPLSDAFTGNYALTDHNGIARTDKSFAGKPVLVYFGFTSCPDVCPAALGIMSAALNEMGRDADNIQPLFIALDPERDSVEVMKTYLAFDPRILGLTGSAGEIDAAKAGFKVYAQKQALAQSALDYTINHSSFFYFVSADGTPTHAIKDSLAPGDLAAFVRYQASL